MNRAEVFEGTGPTPGSYIQVKMGADKAGRLTAAQAYLAYEAGAYPGSPVGPGAMCIFACYDIPNVHIDGYDVVVNKPATSAYRAPGRHQRRLRRRDGRRRDLREAEDRPARLPPQERRPRRDAPRRRPGLSRASA